MFSFILCSSCIFYHCFLVLRPFTFCSISLSRSLHSSSSYLRFSCYCFLRFLPRFSFYSPLICFTSFAPSSSITGRSSFLHFPCLPFICFTSFASSCSITSRSSLLHIPCLPSFLSSPGHKISPLLDSSKHSYKFSVYFVLCLHSQQRQNPAMFGIYMT